MQRSVRILALLALMVAPAGCHRDKTKPITLGTLPADDSAAARALGEAAASEKDPAKLAALVAAFLDRLHVPVVKTDGSVLIVGGPIEGPVPKSPWLWEPSLQGIARATTLGDERPLAVVLDAFFPKAQGHFPEIDLGHLATEFASEAAQGNHDPPVLLGAALDADLVARKEVRPSPRLDPTATLLLGLLVISTAVPTAAAAPAPAPTSAPQLPKIPKFQIPKIPNLPPAPKVTEALDLGGGAGPCGWMAKALGGARTAKTGAGWLGINPTSVAKWTGASEEMQGAIAGAMKSAGELGNLASTIMQGLAGMGIAAFVDTKGDVNPTKVEYGDGPAKYRVGVVSTLPVKKDQLDQFIKCMDATDPTGTMATLDDLPPQGPIANVPVVWEGVEAYDPKHGKFTAEKGGGAGLPVVGAALTSILQAGNANFTGSDGIARATFQVKKAKQKGGAAKFERFVITANIFPFPVGASKVYAGANELFSRSEPIALEIKIPQKYWTLTLLGKSTVHPMGMMGSGFLQTLTGKVPFQVNEDMSISGHGTASGSYSLPPQQNGAAECDAPAGSQSYDVDISGRLENMETGQAHIDLKITTQQTSMAMTITCRVRGHAAKRSANARLGSDITQGTKAESFTFTLAEDSTQEVSLSKSVSVVNIDGTLSLTANVASPE